MVGLGHTSMMSILRWKNDCIPEKKWNESAYLEDHCYFGYFFDSLIDHKRASDSRQYHRNRSSNEIWSLLFPRKSMEFIRMGCGNMKRRSMGGLIDALLRLRNISDRFYFPGGEEE